VAAGYEVDIHAAADEDFTVRDMVAFLMAV